jgi:hypothetical protein
MSPAEVNGHGQDIHDNVIYIRGSISKLEAIMTELGHSVDGLAKSIDSSTTSNEKVIRYLMESNEKTIKTVSGSLPIKFVLVICGIICMAFVGGGVLKELADAHVFSQLFRLP